MIIPSLNKMCATLTKEPLWLEKLGSFLKLGIPLSLTYYIQSGVAVTHPVMIKDVICQTNEPELVLANGKLIPLSDVLDIRYPEEKTEKAPVKRFSEQEIYKFQL